MALFALSFTLHRSDLEFMGIVSWRLSIMSSVKLHVYHTERSRAEPCAKKCAMLKALHANLHKGYMILRMLF